MPEDTATIPMRNEVCMESVGCLICSYILLLMILKTHIIQWCQSLEMRLYTSPIRSGKGRDKNSYQELVTCEGKGI
jgi:hypothetical protein